MQKIKVTNGTIVLPSPLRRTWEGRDVLLNESEHTLTLTESNNGSGVDLDAWRKAAGMLGGEITEDPVAWQRNIRAEWDRVLP